MSLDMIYSELFKLERDKTRQVYTLWFAFPTTLGILYGFYFQSGKLAFLLVIPFFIVCWAIFMMWNSVYTYGLRVYLEYIEGHLEHNGKKIIEQHPLWFSEVRKVLIHDTKILTFKGDTPLHNMLIKNTTISLILLYLFIIGHCIYKINKWGYPWHYFGYLYLMICICFLVYVLWKGISLYSIYGSYVIDENSQWKEKFRI